MLTSITVWLSNVFRLGLKELASLASDKVLFTFIIYSFSFSVYSVATGVKTEIENASSIRNSRWKSANGRPLAKVPMLMFWNQSDGKPSPM